MTEVKIMQIERQEKAAKAKKSNWASQMKPFNFKNLTIGPFCDQKWGILL